MQFGSYTCRLSDNEIIVAVQKNSLIGLSFIESYYRYRYIFQGIILMMCLFISTSICKTVLEERVASYFYNVISFVSVSVKFINHAAFSVVHKHAG